jgi:hypothetical protein
MPSHRLTKSNLLHYRQCPKRLYLSIHRPDLAEFDPATERLFDQGHRVGAVAREVYGQGRLIELHSGSDGAVEQTIALVNAGSEPLYEGTFIYDEVLIRSDILLPSGSGFRAIEVKQATSVKETYPDDCAIQSWVIEQAGLSLAGFSIAHINNQFVYQGDGNYRGLFTEVSMDESVHALHGEVPKWVADAKKVIEGRRSPDVKVGRHCKTPYDCPFMGYCHLEEPEFPIKILPHPGKLLVQLEAEGIADIRDIPDGRLTKPLHQRIHKVTLSGTPELDATATEIARAISYPRHYLDFETIAFAVPIWKGTRPYQQLPFQWSLHIEESDGSLTHRAFLDTSGEFPLRACAEGLLDAIATTGPVIVYTAFEAMRLKELAQWFPDLALRIESVLARLFDLHKVMHEHYYHRDMMGSWSIKKVLPTIAPDLDYAVLGEVADGEAAQRAFLSAIDHSTDIGDREDLRKALLRYCEHDTMALVRILRFIATGK